MSSDEDSAGEELVQIEDIMKWTKNDMCEWLKKNNLPKSGRNKDTLARRILRHMLGDETSEDDDEDEDDEPKAQAPCQPVIPVCPGKDDSKWAELTQPEQIPNLREEDVINYYLHGKNPVTGGSKNCRRYLEKARKFSIESKYIGEMGVCDSGEHTMVKCHVKPSMKKGIYYCTVTMFKDTGLVVTGSCECKVGLTGLCSHVGGVLLRLIRLKNPCTSQLCGWGMPTSSIMKASAPQKLYDINWWPGKSDPKKPWPYQYTAGPCDEECSESFLKDVLEGLETANPSCSLYIHKCKTNLDISPFIDSFMAPCVIDDTENLNEPWVQDLFEDFVEDLTVPTELARLVERATRGQSCNPLWLEARHSVITASNFGRVISRRDSTSPNSTLQYLCGYRTVPKTKAMQYGCRFEAKARKQYMKQHHKSCSHGDKVVKVQSVGLVVSPKHPFLGASLDGFVDCPKCGKGGLEIKCPWKYRRQAPSDIGLDKTSCCTVKDNSLVLKPSHKYWYQVQGQMAVTGLRWTDFVIYTHRGISVERISFDETKWENDMLPKLRAFYKTYRVAEFFTGRIKRNLDLYE